MNITTSRKNLGEISEGALIIPVFEGETPFDPAGAPALAAVDHLTGGALETIFKDGEIDGKRDRWTLHNIGGLSTRRLLLYGAGKPGTLDSLALQRLAGAIIRILAARGVR